MKRTIPLKKIREISIPNSNTIRSAMQAIDAGGLGVAILVDESTNEFRGLITDGDIRRALLKGAGLESPVLTVDRPQTRTAKVGMSLNEISSMFSNPIRVVPIIDKNGKITDLALFDKRVYLPVAEPYLGEKELTYVSECILSGWVSSKGRFVSEFEHKFGEFCKTQYAISTCNGTCALHLAIIALGIGPGDEVIVPSFTFVATANAVTYTGAKPIFVDSETDSWNLDPNQIERSITPRTKAIVIVHIFGHPAKMEQILKIAKKHKLLVIEDAAEAIGAEYKGIKIGTFGQVGIFSFYGNKIITTGEGGMIVTKHKDIADKVQLLRDHGMSATKRYWHTEVGYNYRMTNLQAALGLAQLEKIEDIIHTKIKIAEIYGKGLQSVKGIVLPPSNDWAKNVYWMYSIVIEEKEFGISRDELMKLLLREDIETRPLFPPLHTQPIYNTGQSLAISQWLGKNGLSLPSSVNLSLNDQKRVFKCIVNISKKNKYVLPNNAF